MNSVDALLARNNVLLAPMAGVTEAPFRAICKQQGAGLTYTEMVSATGLHHNPNASRSLRLLTFAPEEVPCGVQLFGSDAQVMAQQACALLERYPGQIALIDINMGCPVSKVVAKGQGSALMRTPERAAELVASVARAVDVPVTVKIRAGWDHEHVNAPEFARQMESAGAVAVAVHGRTRGQFYKGKADWSIIARVKEAVSVPVIGSGDVFSAADVRAMFSATGVDAVMVARGAQGNPWIFREARALLDRGEMLAPPTPAERIGTAREHARELVGQSGERAVVRMRKHVAWYLADMPHAAHVRALVNSCRTAEELDELLASYEARLAVA